MNPFILYNTNEEVKSFNSIAALLEYVKIMMPSGLYYVQYISVPFFTIMAEQSFQWENTLSIIFYDDTGNETIEKYVYKP